MKLLYFVPGSMSLNHDGARELQRRHELLKEIAPPDVAVSIKDYPQGPASIESVAEEQLAIPGVLSAAQSAQQAGFDAMIIGCYSDPGLAASREVSDALIVGPAEASLLFSLGIGRKTAIVTTLRSSIPSMEELVYRSGLKDRVACVRAVDIPVLQLRNEAARVRAELAAEVRQARLAGADSVIPGCMTLAFMDLEEHYVRDLTLPLINPVRAAVWLAYAYWGAGLHHSRAAFPVPRKLDQFSLGTASHERELADAKRAQS